MLTMNNTLEMKHSFLWTTDKTDKTSLKTEIQIPFEFIAHNRRKKHAVLWSLKVILQTTSCFQGIEVLK